MDTDTRRIRAEALYEEIGGDLCICQRADVLHWCENCQRRIDVIEVALTRDPDLLHPVIPAEARAKEEQDDQARGDSVPGVGRWDLPRLSMGVVRCSR